MEMELSDLKKETNITFKLSQEEKLFIKEYAKKKGTDVSKILRRHISNLSKGKKNGKN